MPSGGSGIHPISLAARGAGFSGRLQIQRGPSEEAIRAISTVDDVLVIGQPNAASDRLVRSFYRRLDVALRTPSSVLVVPADLAVGGSTILGVSAELDEPMLAVASLAGAIGERVVTARSIEEFIMKHGRNPKLVVMERDTIKLDPVVTAATIVDRSRVPLLILPAWMRAGEAASKEHVSVDADRF